LLAAVMLLIVLALVIAAIVILSTPEPTRIVLKNVIYEHVQDAASALRQLVSENTQ
jgi:beta-lactam-binding protein with PASTA domain